VPAKVLATELDPDAKLARPPCPPRLRLLAFNGEAWLAEHFHTRPLDEEV
jgi:hypothetical protein